MLQSRDTAEATSEENVERVRRGSEHFARTGEPDASLYAPDIEWHSAAEDPGREVFHRVEGVKKLIEEVQRPLRTSVRSRSSLWTQATRWWRDWFTVDAEREAPPRS